MPLKTLLAVRTTERSLGAYYLEETLSAIDREGGLNHPYRMIFSDGPFPLPEWPPSQKLLGWPAIRSRTRVGTRVSLWRLFSYVIEHGFDQALVFEDDAIVVRNAVSFMLDFEVPPEIGFVTFFDSYECEEGTPYGLYIRPTIATDGWGFRYSQCILIPVRTMRFLLNAYPDPTEIIVRTSEDHHGIPVLQGIWRKGDKNRADNAIGFALAGSPWPRYAVFVPTLVRHIGVASSASPGPFDKRKIERNIPGPDFDALIDLKKWIPSRVKGDP